MHRERALSIVVKRYRFPFLVGRIRAVALSPVSAIPEPFPFLVGRIRARDKGFRVGWNGKFPFLVGRIRAG